MKEIDEAIKERSLSEAIRLRKQLKEARVSDKEIEARLFALKHKEFSSNFKSYSRDRRDEIFASKTNPPPVGQYNPMFFAGVKEDRHTIIHEPGTNTEKAIERKIELWSKADTLCDHLLEKIHDPQWKNLSKVI